MSLVQSLNDKLCNMYTDEDVLYYIEKWHEEYDDFGHSNFDVSFKDERQKKIDLKKTLHGIDGKTLLKMAIDLGVETPDFIPAIPMFKNELKSNFEMASQTFEKACKSIEEDPSLSIGLANSALESIIKEILKDKRVGIQHSDKDTLTKLIGNICKAFRLIDPTCPKEIKTIASSLINGCKAIEDIRSDKTIFHGKTDENDIIRSSVCACFIVNSVSTIGLFLLSFYKEKYPTKQIPQSTNLDSYELPF